MADFIVILILIFCVSWACFYIYKSKKSGAVCMGCPHAGTCHGACGKKKKK